MITITLDPAQAESSEATPQEIVEFYFKEDAPVMLAIAQCESEQRQFEEDGTVLISDTNDWGFFQINATHWDNEAKRLNLKYKESLKDNIQMALHIKNKQGLRAWTTYKNGCYKKHLN